MVWRFLKKLGIKPPYDPPIPLLDTYTPMFIAALFAIAKTWKQPRCPSTNECIKLLYLYTMGILLSHKKEHIWVSSNEVDEPRAYYTEWSKSERERQILYTNTYIWNLERWYWIIYLQSSNGETDIENRLMDRGRREERVRCMDRVTWKLNM